MTFHRRLALLSSAVFFTGLVHAADIEDEDLQALRDWINSKRMITVKELGGQLSISGDVHAEMQSISETRNGVAQRGRGATTPNNTYDVELNLMVDYRTDRSWLAGRLRFDNDAGVISDNFGSGTNNKIKVDRAFWGYRFIDADRHTMDIEMGRRGGMTSVFDSKLQFNSNLDGVVLKDNYALDKVGDLYYQLALFMVNEKKDQIGYVGEAGILNIANTGFYTKYSLIDWDTKANQKIKPQFHFIISQLLLGYKWIPQALDRPVTLYSAGLYNHRARPLSVSDNRRANWGGYLGFSVGALKLAGDWAFDANYQILQAQCLPDFDVSGIGMGNTSGNGFYYTKSGATITPSTRETAEGNVNYRGFELTLQYLISNNLNLWQNWKQSITLDDDIGPFRRYKQYEVDFIYSF